MLNAIEEKLTSLLRNKQNLQYCTNLFVRHDLKHAIIKIQPFKYSLTSIKHITPSETIQYGSEGLYHLFICPHCYSNKRASDFIIINTE